MQQKSRAFLKWAGGKYSLVENINARLNQASKHADTLVEPFVGAGSLLQSGVARFYTKAVCFTDQRLLFLALFY